jgi:hypothetical protein
MPSPLWYLLFKGLLFVLLACNAVIYLTSGTVSEALDTAAWFALLISFELETGCAAHLRPRLESAIRVVRVLAAVTIAAAAVGYTRDEAWLDVGNIALWIMVVVLLEVELRFPAAVARHRPLVTATAALLYTGLLALVPMWAWRDEWFDAYDALLWLAVFATIEMDVLRVAQPAANTHAQRGGSS